MAENGMLYPGQLFNQQHACYGICGDYIPWVSRRRKWNAMGKSLLREVEAYEGDVLISSEALSSMDSEGVAHFCDQLDGVDLVIMTVRNFAKTLLSAWQQNVKGGGKSTLNDFFRRLERDSETKKGLWKTYEFGAIAERWSKRANVELIVVGEGDKSAGDPLLETFSRVIGITLADPGPMSESERNVSLHFEDVEVLRHINVLFEAMPRKDRERMIRKLLKDHFFPAALSRSGQSIGISSAYLKKAAMWAEQEIESVPLEVSVHGNLRHLVKSERSSRSEVKALSRDESFQRFVEIVGTRGR